MSKNNISKELFEQAKLAYNNAYAPYSKFHVGAALETSQGNVFAGCNVENASYGLTVCAERNAIAQAVISGEQTFKSIVIYTEEDNLVPPCGACRQVIAEFFSLDSQVSAVNGNGKVQTWTVSELLPHAFTPDFLNKER